MLDVNSNPNNPIIGSRSFGTEPNQVITFAWPYVQGLRDGGIIPCGKHFPGHGGTDKDSHLDLPVLDRSPDELTAVELPPFVHACRNQIESLMTAHVLYRSLDPKFLSATSNDDDTHFCLAKSFIMGSAGDRGTPGKANDSCP